MTLKLLVIEGNTSEGREIYRAGFGRTASDSYASTLRELAPDADCAIVQPADAGANLPGPEGLEAYDGVFMTGSSLNLYDGGPEITRQIELARAVFASRTPFFGSCWGLQVASAAAGGTVVKNPRGREIGVARKIWPTEAGARHPLLAGRPGAYDALCSHIDHLGSLPPDAVALGSNAFSEVQAAEIRHDGGLFWGVQYHPEYSFAEVAAILARRAEILADEGLFADAGEARAYAEDLTRLDAPSPPPGLAFRLGLDADVTTPERRRLELVNFLERCVRPNRSARGRQ